jgi:hypothetical protein
MCNCFKTIYFYADGMATYCKNNNVKNIKGKFAEENTLDSIRTEFGELIGAIKNLDFSEIILEFFDVVHSTIKCFIVNVFPERIYCHFLIWFMVFPLVFPVGIKLANRNKSNGCIRNHSNKNNINHNCIHSMKYQ